MYLLFIKKISKSIMAPMVANIKEKSELKNIKFEIKNEKQKLIKIRNFIENNFEYVGDNFSKKVREIYYDDKSKKNLWNNYT